MENKQYLKQSVKEYLSKTRRSIELSDNLNKSNTEKRVIETLFDVLGWPLRAPEENISVELDYEVGNSIIDYAVLVDGEPEVCVRTQSFKTELPNEEYVESALTNGGFELGIITNGFRYLCCRSVEGEVYTVRDFNLDNLEENRGFLTFMSSESLTSGRTSAECQRYDNFMMDKNSVNEITERVEAELSQRLVSVDSEKVEKEVVSLRESIISDTEQDFFIDESEKTDAKDESSKNTRNSEDEETDIEKEDINAENEKSAELTESEDSESEADSGNSSSESSGKQSEDSSEKSSGNKSIGGIFKSIVTFVF